jgi:hypothetical protein
VSAAAIALSLTGGGALRVGAIMATFLSIS